MDEYNLLKKYKKFVLKKQYKKCMVGGSGKTESQAYASIGVGIPDELEPPEEVSNNSEEISVEEILSEDKLQTSQKSQPLQQSQLSQKSEQSLPTYEQSLPTYEQIDQVEQLQQLQQSFNPVPIVAPSEPSKLTLYELKVGTILYHPTYSKETFDPDVLILGKNNIPFSFFTPCFELAKAHIGNCGLTNNMSKKHKIIPNGYIHQFTVKNNISKIFISHPNELTKNYKKIKNHFCNSNKNFDGLGCFFPSTQSTSPTQDSCVPSNQAKFWLCNPDGKLQYNQSWNCINIGKLSPPYNFNQ